MLYNSCKPVISTETSVMIFKRKVYEKLLDWKARHAGSYSVLLEGARRVGKSTVAEEFAKNEYDSYIMIDFANASKTIMDCFDDITEPDAFFLRLQAATGIRLIPGRSVIVFDEIQLYPRARQAIKYLVKDGRYHYIETGSLISIKKNVKDILIPSEEMKIPVHPMDYEEFLWATGSDSYDIIRQIAATGKPAGEAANRKLMRDFRIYMAVGGMPQAVVAYTERKSFEEIDEIKRQIIGLYSDDFKKIDPSGRISAIYRSIPAQLSKNAKRYVLRSATGKRGTARDEERIYDLVDSKTVNISYNTTDPGVSLSDTKELESYKLYVGDTGLFVTMMFIDRPAAENELYIKLMSDKLPANLGYLYENAVAQMIAAADKELYYHTWEKPGSTHYYEIDFLVSGGAKLKAIEVKSSGTGNHKSLTEFRRKYSSKTVSGTYIVSQKDLKNEKELLYRPVYMTDFILEE